MLATSICIVDSLWAGELVTLPKLFQEWAFFKEESACWIATAATFVEKPFDLSNDNFMYISFFDGVPHPQLSFNLADTAVGKSLFISQDIAFELMYLEGTFFPVDGDVSLVMRLLKEDKISIINQDQQSTYAEFSLRGFVEAYNEAGRSCNFVRPRGAKRA